MSHTHWDTTKKVGIPCLFCGKIGSCTVSPDRTAFKCWRDHGKVHRIDAAQGQGNAYIGATHRQRLTRKGSARSFAAREAAIDAAVRNVRCEHADAKLTRIFEYQQRDGSLSFCVARIDWLGDKTFHPVHLHKDHWREGDPAGKLPLYRINDVPASGPVYVTEGETACEAARSLGLPAVTSAHGSSSAKKSDCTPLAGRELVILPDNDEPGRGYARDVAVILLKLGARVKIVALPGLPEGGDIVEYINDQDSLDSTAIAESVRALANGEPYLNPADYIGGPVLTCLADVESCEIKWLWPGRIALGRITLLVGRPGGGKSFATCDFAARVSNGTHWPDGTPCPRGSVIFISAEDDAADTIRPRLDAQHADCRKIHLLLTVRRIDEDGNQQEMMFTLTDVASLEKALKDHPDCKLVVIDPIGSFLGGGVDAHRDNEVRGVLAPVAALAARYGVAVLVVAHCRKASATIADDMALGSRAFTGIARTVWHLFRDPTNEARRLLLPGKNNLAAEGDGLAFAIAGDPPMVVWEDEPVPMTADDALAMQNSDADDERSKPGPEPKARATAEAWLLKLMVGGEVPAAQVREEANAAGLVYRTVQRAADQLGVIREKNQFTGRWQWRLPRPGAQDDKLASCSETSKNLSSCPLGENAIKNISVTGGLGEGDKLSHSANSNGNGQLFAVVPPAGFPDGNQRRIV